ncbi:DoxX family membrane protein [Flavobacterium sp.]|jgi:putative oxidoreductase|uniref:DoxX family membrane protein n=1 Tax=Flavobacterium sp. TaxID=239 RepID=UPI0008CE0759|nr:DoxX family membrane protein [Flavobacterium sp.]OGS62915.1 MAG: DoxX family protein [Flavobacteria bacterium GWF1_32_7]HBD25986.1 DoxX family protein [Flavobacterium sp.]
MKIATIIVRVLLGAMMLFASISYFFNLGEQPAPTGDMATLMGGLMASKYMFPLVKSIELIAGLMLVSGKFVKLGTLLLLPISVNIFLIHTVTQVSDLPVAIFVLVANVFLIYAYWNDFKEIVKP